MRYSLAQIPRSAPKRSNRYSQTQNRQNRRPRQQKDDETDPRNHRGVGRTGIRVPRYYRLPRNESVDCVRQERRIAIRRTCHSATCVRWESPSCIMYLKSCFRGTCYGGTRYVPNCSCRNSVLIRVFRVVPPDYHSAYQRKLRRDSV